MNSEIMVALIVASFGFAGTIIGSYFGVRASNKLTNYRIDELTKKVDKHNTIIERMYIVESICKENANNISELKGELKC